jgi:hypothetical protein
MDIFEIPICENRCRVIDKTAEFGTHLGETGGRGCD